MTSTTPADGELLDLVYGTILDPALWTPVMERLADRIGGDRAALTRINLTTGFGEAILARSDPKSVADYNAYYASKNVMALVDDPTGYRSAWTPTLLQDHDWMPRDEFIRTEFYNDFWRPQGIDRALFFRLSVGEQDSTAINVGRPEGRSVFAFEELEFAAWLHPHLIRARRLGAQFADGALAFEGLSAALDRTDRAYFILDERGRIRHANGVGYDLLTAGDAIASIGGRLCAVDPRAARELNALISEARSPEEGRRRAGSGLAPSGLRRRPLAVAVAPLDAPDAAIYAPGRSVVVCVTDLDQGRPPLPDELRRLFGLTAAEARVAAALYEGHSARTISELFAVSLHTVRFQIARIHEKTGVGRQAELVRLIARAVGGALG